MTAKEFARWYRNHPIVTSGGVCGPDYKEFHRKFTSFLKTICKNIGAEVVTFKCGHYISFGFVKKDGNYVYVSISDQRFWPLVTDPTYDTEGCDAFFGILIRTAKDERDCRGGSNNFTNIMRLEKDLQTFFC